MERTLINQEYPFYPSKRSVEFSKLRQSYLWFARAIRGANQHNVEKISLYYIVPSHTTDICTKRANRHGAS